MKTKSYLPTLVVLFAAAFISSYNENIINVALVDIMAQFGVSSTTAQWLVTGYMIVTSVVVIMMAFLAQRFTSRQLVLAACGFLVIGSVGAYLAPTFPILLAMRLFQAFGTGIFIPVMMNTVLATAPKARLGTYLSIGSAAITLGPAFAPVASGLMVTLLGWRSIFIVPAAVTFVLAIAAIRLVRNVGETHALHFDVLSLVFSAVGLTLFVYGLGEITANLPVALATLAVGIAALAAFARRQDTLEHPMLNLHPLRRPRFSLAMVLVIIAMMTTFSMSVLLPLYFEGALGTTALVAGALILPPIVGNALTSVLGGRIMDRRGTWPLLPVGFLLITVGQFAAAFAGGALAATLVVTASVVVYAGVGLVMSPSQTAALKTLPREENPHGVAINSTLVMVAASIGPSLFIGILSSAAASASVTGASAAQAQAAGFSGAVIVAAFIGAAGLALAFFYALSARRSAAAAVTAANEPQTANAAAGMPQVGAAAAQTSQAARPAIGAQRAEMPAVASGAETSREPVSPTLGDVMMRDVYTVRDDATVREVAALLLEAKTSGVPVVDDANRVLGFISDGDIMRGLARQESVAPDLSYYVSAYRDDETLEQKVAEVLSSNVMDLATRRVVSVDARADLEQVCKVLAGKRIKKLPVLSEGRLVGCVSRSDIVRELMGAFISEEREAEGAA